MTERGKESNRKAEKCVVITITQAYLISGLFSCILQKHCSKLCVIVCYLLSKTQKIHNCMCLCSYVSASVSPSTCVQERQR